MREKAGELATQGAHVRDAGMRLSDLISRRARQHASEWAKLALL